MKLSQKISILLLVMSVIPVSILTLLAYYSIFSFRNVTTQTVHRRLGEKESEDLIAMAKVKQQYINETFKKVKSEIEALHQYYQIVAEDPTFNPELAPDYYPAKPHPGLPGYGYIHPDYGMYADFDRLALSTSYLRKSVVARAMEDAELRLEIVHSLHRTKQLEPFFNALTTEYGSNLDLVWIVMTNGVVNVCPKYDLLTLITQDPRLVDLDENTEVYVRNVDPEHNPSKETRWLEPYLDAYKSIWMISCITPIYDQDRFVGTMGMDMLLSTMTSKVLDQEQPSEGYGFLIDSKGKPIAFPPKAIDHFISDPKLKSLLTELFTNNSSRIWQDSEIALIESLDIRNYLPPEIVTEMKQMKEGVRLITIQDKQYYLAHTPIPDYGWSIGLVMPYEVVTQLNREIVGKLTTATTNILSGFLFLLIVIVVLCIGAAYLYGYQISRPVKKLISHTVEIGRGNLEITAAISPKHTEFYEIERSLVVMAQTLRKNEQELKRYTSDLEGLVKESTKELRTRNEELRSFSYSVSHDLQAPLRRVGYFGELLANSNAQLLTDEGKNCLQGILRNVHDMSKLVHDMLILARADNQEIVKSEVDLRPIAESVYAEQAKELGDRSVTFIIKELPIAFCDPDLMRQVFCNLISNAIKFTKPKKDAVIEIGSTNDNGEIVYYVKDNGVGFDMLMANRLFMAFKQFHSSSEFPGSGIGLATVHRIVTRHGGRIWAHSVEGASATFYFTLPR